MNILIDAHVFDSKHQGTRTYLKGLYTELIPLAVNWHFYFAANNTENLKTEFGEHPNVTYVTLKSNNKFYRLLMEFPEIIKKNQIDFAHYQYISPIFKNCKQIITTHDILFEQKEFKKFFPLKYRIINGLLFKLSAKRADVLLTVSEYSKNKIAEIYKIESNLIGITPNAVSNAYFDSKELNTVPNINLGKYILYVSRVEPRKNHLNLLKAFVELQLAIKGYKLVCIGKKDILFSDLKNYINQIEPMHSESILWIENISNKDLMAYYKNCELFVFPSFAEGFGIPPLEAMAMGSKVLCSKDTAMADFNLPDSLTFDPHNVEELKQKIEKQLENDEVLTEVYKNILANYNWTNVAKTFYNHILHHQKKQ